MILFPAIDIKDGRCVRLKRGDFATAEQVADDPVQTARSFALAGAEWLHTVDLDGALHGRPRNREILEILVRESGLKVQVGGGIRNLETLESYLRIGAARCVIGSAALSNPDFVRQAVRLYGEKVAVGIDAKGRNAAGEGWTKDSGRDFSELAREMEALGVQTLIFTDISKDGLLQGPNFERLFELNEAVSCDVIASGGVTTLEDLQKLKAAGLYGAILGKALYAGTLNLRDAAALVREPVDRVPSAERLFRKSELIPAVVQEEGTGRVLMVAYMNRQAYEETLRTGRTCFYSRSRGRLWRKGETSGHVQHVRALYADCDEDTLLVTVAPVEAACHTGAHSCFFRPVSGM